jgi:hypothetical protein
MKTAAPERSFTQMPIHMVTPKVISKAIYHREWCPLQSWGCYVDFQGTLRRRTSFGSFFRALEADGLKFQMSGLKMVAFIIQTLERVAASMQSAVTFSAKTSLLLMHLSLDSHPKKLHPWILSNASCWSAPSKRWRMQGSLSMRLLESVSGCLLGDLSPNMRQIHLRIQKPFRCIKLQVSCDCLL